MDNLTAAHMDAARITLVLLLVLLLFNMSFELIDENLPERAWWPFFDDYMLTPEFYWHEFQDQVNATILCFVIAYQSKFYRSEFLCYAWLKFFDGVDFVLTNNTPWFHFGSLPISLNILAISIFVFVVIRALWNGRGQLI